jgi:hypothetical protein
MIARKENFTQKYIWQVMIIIGHINISNLGRNLFVITKYLVFKL